MGKILNTLTQLGLASKESSEVFSARTRDNDNLLVMRDSVSGIIYIDGFCVDRNEYVSGSYREGELSRQASLDFERVVDSERRLTTYKKYYTGLNICDVGCGAGDFLRGASSMAQSVSGVGLQKDYLEALSSDGIPCSAAIEDFEQQYNTIFSFHALEHFEDPIVMLKSMREKLVEGGKIIIEVPHANDFLISTLKCQPFIDFTLWSQHLILHTRDSLKRFLLEAGFANVLIEGVQRYPLSNHLTWLSESKPEGHKSTLALLDEPELHHAYESVLRKADITDTLVAIATA